MSIPSHIYQPSPSVALNNKGKIVETTFYLVENGMLSVDDGNEEHELECSFEIAQMQSGESWCIVYLQPNTKFKLWQFHLWLEEIDSNKCTLTLSGQDKLMGTKINVSIRYVAWRPHQVTLPTLEHGYRLDCLVQRYEAVRAETTSKWVDFHITNLPITSHLAWKNVYDSERYNSREAKFEATLNAVIDEIENIYSADEVVNVGDIKSHLQSLAKKSSQDFVKQNNRLVERKYIPIVIDDNEIAHIYHRIDYTDREYNNEPLAILRINQQLLDSDWDVEDIADWICSVLSLGLGRDINWQSNYISKISDNPKLAEYAISDSYLSYARVWRYKIVNHGKFFALTEETTYIDMKWGINIDSECLKLVNDVLPYIITIPSMAGAYHYLLRNYIGYASHETTDIKHKSILLALLGEDIFKRWQEVCEEIDPDDSNKYHRSTKYPAPNGTTREPTLFQILMWFFEKHGWKVDGLPNTYDYLPTRIWEYVESRNSLFHDHKLFTETQEEWEEFELIQEMNNIAGLVPLMLATVLRYRGGYWHPLSGREKESMPS